LRLTVLVRRGDEEHVARLDEGPVALVDVIVDDPLLDPVGESPGVEAILE
jgi:hypothetical protein